ncbi:ATP-binding protein [Thiothrix subterranea]|uniref:ATP-binding protein n=1 Tax=Thiothrix subterranea TaxID=2735563 RepID=UPI00280AD008|nr:ATP-binding protein [Thiothrix subterranea]
MGFSGGLDSHVLLHACASLREHYPHLTFRALHIDHGLQAMSAAWAAHCREVCTVLEIPLVVEALELVIPAGESVEAVARNGTVCGFPATLASG